MKNNKISAFTLVELIVVITILAVLATVAFISFQGYTSSSRDSVRLADLKNIEKQLNIHFTQKNFYPQPSDAVSIPTGWSQWTLAKSVTNQIWVWEVTDPLTKEYYFYRTTENKRKYQLLGFLEKGDSISKNSIQNTFAQNDIPYSKWDKLGIILNSDGKTLPETIDFATQIYDVIFSNATEENLVNITWEDNFVELKAAEKWFFDESLVWYWDMETLTSDWKLADLSGNNNHGTINDANASGLATPVNGAMFFDGVDDYVEVEDNSELSLTWYDITLLTVIDLGEINDNRQRIFTKYWWTPLAWYAATITNSSVWWRYEPFIKINGYWVAPDYEKSVPTNTKILLAMTKDSQKISMYQWDDLLGEEYYQNWEIWDSTWWNAFIWTFEWSREFFNWKIDEIMIFNRALSQVEINNIYEVLQ